MTTSKIERGARIQAVRKNLGLNQEQFGKKLGGIAKSTISGYESGDTDPKPETLAQIAKLGNASLDWLITGDEWIKKAVQARVRAEKEASKGYDFELSEERHRKLIQAVLKADPRPGMSYVAWLDRDDISITHTTVEGGDAILLLEWDWEENEWGDYQEENIGLEVWLEEEFAHGRLLSPFGREWLYPKKITVEDERLQSIIDSWHSLTEKQRDSLKNFTSPGPIEEFLSEKRAEGQDTSWVTLAFADCFPEFEEWLKKHRAASRVGGDPRENIG
ncbi:MAG: helix-turn-helix domain-containing protein [Desulfobulbaceae bacterium]|nr:helix-turn-helix domain-containing protein [Desulfobulbaceae bacterium]